VCPLISDFRVSGVWTTVEGSGFRDAGRRKGSGFRDEVVSRVGGLEDMVGSKVRGSGVSRKVRGSVVRRFGSPAASRVMGNG